MANRQLTKKTKSNSRGVILTRNVRRPFRLCFEYKLHKDYTFETLQIADLKALQKFLDIVSALSFTEVDARYLRKPDKSDTFLDLQVIHYEVSQGFRLHGIIDNEMFKVLRIDPNHKVHK